MKNNLKTPLVIKEIERCSVLYQKYESKESKSCLDNYITQIMMDNILPQKLPEYIDVWEILKNEPEHITKEDAEVLVRLKLGRYGSFGYDDKFRLMIQDNQYWLKSNNFKDYKYEKV